MFVAILIRIANFLEKTSTFQKEHCDKKQKELTKKLNSVKDEDENEDEESVTGKSVWKEWRRILCLPKFQSTTQWEIFLNDNHECVVEFFVRRDCQSINSFI